MNRQFAGVLMATRNPIVLRKIPAYPVPVSMGTVLVAETHPHVAVLMGIQATSVKRSSFVTLVTILVNTAVVAQMKARANSSVTASETGKASFAASVVASLQQITVHLHLIDIVTRGMEYVAAI